MKKKLGSLIVAWSMLFPAWSNGNDVSPNAKKMVTIHQETKENMSKTFVVTWQVQEELDHEKIVAMPFDQIFASYGKVKWLEIIREHFLIEVNKHRASPLHKDPVLTQIAQEQAQDMWDNTYFNHSNKDWISASDRAKWKYDYATFGSNISFNLDNIKKIIQSYIDNGKRNTWHDRIFSSEYADVWFGLVKGKDGKYYVVADYGTKRTPK